MDLTLYADAMIVKTKQTKPVWLSNTQPLPQTTFESIQKLFAFTIGLTTPKVLENGHSFSMLFWNIAHFFCSLESHFEGAFQSSNMPRHKIELQASKNLAIFNCNNV